MRWNRRRDISRAINRANQFFGVYGGTGRRGGGCDNGYDAARLFGYYVYTGWDNIENAN